MRDVVKDFDMPHPLKSALIYASSLAGYLHDIGKSTEEFQTFLRAGGKSLEEQKSFRDKVRHEFVSYYIVREMGRINDGLSDIVFLENLRTITPESLLSFQKKGCLSLQDDTNKKRGVNRLKVDLAPTPETFIIHAVLFMVLSHHHLPEYSDMPFKPFGINYFKITDKNFSFTPIPFAFENDKWFSIQEPANRLLRLYNRINEATWSKAYPYGLPGLLEYGRVAMRCSDRLISSRLKNEVGVLANEHKELIFANAAWNEDKQFLLRQQLKDHLNRIGKEVKSIFKIFNNFQDADGSLLPKTSFIPRSKSKGPYSWQSDAVLCAKGCRTSCKATNNIGFIGFVTAPTGTGKTLGNMSIIQATDGQPFRATVALGLRALTLQTGKELSKIIPGVYVNIGNELSMALARKEGDLDKERLSSHPEQTDIPLIPEKGQDYMRAPVCVTTIDSLMTYEHNISMALRLMSSDLIIDEYDSYDLVDQSLILGLVKMSGVYGRKVLVSSATLSVTAMKMLMIAYWSGYEEYTLLNNNENKFSINVGLFGKESHLFYHSSVDDAYADILQQSIRYVEKSIEEPSIRKADVISPVNDDRDSVITMIKNGCQTLHENTAVIDPLSGKSVSVGLVRFPHIKDVIEISQSIEQDGIIIIPYHSRTMPVIRYKTEALLDKICCRKNEDDFFQNDFISHVIQTTQGRDVSIWVVASPVEEVGRDHDFDWMLCSLSGTHSLVQSAGRVMRHRQIPRQQSTPNILIMEKPISYYRSIWEERRSSRNQAFFYNPGVETELNYFLNDALGGYKLGTPSIIELMDTEALTERIDSSLCIGTPNSRMGEMAILEQKKLDDVLRFAGLKPIMEYRFTNIKDNFLFRGDDNVETIWKRKDGKWATSANTSETIPVENMDSEFDLSVLEEDIRESSRLLLPDTPEDEARKILTSIDIRTYGMPVTGIKLRFSKKFGMEVVIR